MNDPFRPQSPPAPSAPPLGLSPPPPPVAPIPVEPLVAPSAAEPDAITQPPPRFCRTCGAPWVPTWIECVPCAERTRRIMEAAAADHRENRPGPSLRSALFLYFAFLATTLATAVIGYTSDGDEMPVHIHLTVLALDAALVLAWFFASGGDTVRLLAVSAAPRWYGAAAACSVVTFAVAAIVVGFATRTLNIPEIQYLKPFLDGGYGWGMVVLATCVQPAVIEELAFRGVVFGAMERVMSTRDAVVVSALMFMIIHLSVPGFPHLLLIGLVLGWLRVRTGSLYPCMLMHFLHNFYVVVHEGYEMGALPW